MLLAQGIVRNT